MQMYVHTVCTPERAARACSHTSYTGPGDQRRKSKVASQELLLCPCAGFIVPVIVVACALEISSSSITIGRLRYERNDNIHYHIEHVQKCNLLCLIKGVLLPI